MKKINSNTREGEHLENIEVTDIINMKDFFNHDTRITLLENAVINIDKNFDQIDKRFDQLESRMEKRFEQIDKRFEQVDRKFENMLNKMDSQFKWIMGSFG